MEKFLQLHLLTSYPPSNLNRDDLGRPKSAVMGGETRLRISSQCLKRAWRTSEVFASKLAGHLGTRTKRMGIDIYEALVAKGVAEKKALEWAAPIAAVFGDLEKATKEKPLMGLLLKQLAHFSPEEKTAIDQLVERLAAEGRAPNADELDLLRERHGAADIALFGRMLASKPRYNTDAAAQVAHAVTVHKTAVEDDFFTAVDDLNKHDEDAGAGHMGETEFGAGLYYLYLCVDRERLVKNLGGDQGLAAEALRALTEAAATVAPEGKQNSFGSRAYASYILAEKGGRQPRSLSVAFLQPVSGSDPLARSVEVLNQTLANLDKVYDTGDAESRYALDAVAGEGSLKALLDFVGV